MNLQPDDKLRQWMQDIRRRIHAYPELAFTEVKTARLVADKLRALNIPFKSSIATTGLVATLAAKAKGPGIALRADMDALPLQEQTGLPFASTRPNIMHACGHDGHVAMLLGAGALLKPYEAQLSGPIKLFFQPAEEGGGGANEMIREGVLDGIEMIFAGHIDRHFNVGEIGIQEGLICAFTDEFKITIRGKGGHAAKPHETIDAIVVASLLVVNIQTLISREINPVFPSVVTVGSLHSGSAPNVIAEEAILQGTIRTTNSKVREQIITGLKRMVAAMEDLYDAQAIMELITGYPPVINDTRATEIARKAYRTNLKGHGLRSQAYPSLGGEDFAYYLQQIPGCLVRLGAKSERAGNAAAHSPRFDFNEDVLAIGAQFLAQCALTALDELAGRQP